MKKTIGLLVVMLFVSFSSRSQYVIKSQEELNNLKKLPQEKVFVNHTGPVLFSGEYLYYGFQCFNAQNSRPTKVSKVGYVALINANREYVLEQKIKLEKGLGQGDFFIPTNIPSGNYKLLGYTQWMKNNGLAQIFKDNLVIINPYAADQSALLKDGKSAPINSSINVTEQIIDSSTVGLQLSASKFGKREKVSIALKNYKGYLGNGTYTLRVKKKSTFTPKNRMNSLAFAKAYLNVDKEIDLKVGDSLFLPEQRGELLFGTVTDANTNKPLINTKVVVSLPGKEFVLKFATTDVNGNFYTYLRKDYKERLAILQVENPDASVNINLKQPRKLELSQLEFGGFQLKESFADLIKKRSVYNQIENQYFSLKPDSVLLGDPIDPFDGGIPEVVHLDEYTRFPTFQETMVEILTKAGYRSNGKERDYIRILQDFETFDEDYNDFPAIVVFDGVYITDHEALKDFDARKIKSISLIRDQFQLANKQYQGIMSVETVDADYYEKYQEQNGTSAPIIKPHPKKNYFVQTYNNDKFMRIPDYRTVLFWKPNVVLDGSSVDFEFYTSDVSGIYEVLVDGFTTYGKPISFTRSFTVE